MPGKNGNEESKNYFKKALDIFVQYDDKHSVALVYQNLGNVSASLKIMKRVNRIIKRPWRFLLNLRINMPLQMF